MAQQVFGALWYAMTCEVVGRRHHDEAERIRQPHLDHVALDRLTQSNACVIPFCHDVDESLIDRHLHLDARVTRAEGR